MSERTYVYVDGESHFIRSEVAWREIHGHTASLSQLVYAEEESGSLILVNPKAKVFWTRRMHPNAHRVKYFSSMAGDSKAHFEAMKQLRDFSLEPEVVLEPKTRAAQRENVLRQECLIEKAKGVDISLAVQMIEDAQHLAFDECHLYTSDVDFLPVIEAVKGKGKRVFVHGFRNGLADQSPLLIVPDRFIDLEQMLREECLLNPQEGGH